MSISRELVVNRSVNNSEVQVFRRCLRKWYLGYFLGLELPGDSDRSNLYTGSLVHRCLQLLYEGGDPFAPIVGGREDAEAHEALVIAGEADLNYSKLDRLKDIKLSERMVEGYIEWVEKQGLDSGYRVLQLEQKQEIPLGNIRDRNVSLFFTPDMVVESPDGEVILRDHKTVQTFTDLQKTLHMNDQFKTYWWGLAEKGIDVDAAEVNMLRKVLRTGSARPPYYMREQVRFNELQLASHKKFTIGTIDRMLALEDAIKEYGPEALTAPFLAPTIDSDCTWKCPFFKICPMVDDGSDIQSALEDLYQQKVLAA